MEKEGEQQGIVNRPSARGARETLDRLEALVRSKGMTVFARIDQSAAAQQVGQTLRPTEMLLFGDPRSGTPLMERFPLVALDLPLKALSWQDDFGQVWLTYNSPSYLQQRFGLPLEAFQSIDSLMALALD